MAAWRRKRRKGGVQSVWHSRLSLRSERRLRLAWPLRSRASPLPFGELRPICLPTSLVLLPSFFLPSPEINGINDLGPVRPPFENKHRCRIWTEFYCARAEKQFQLAHSNAHEQALSIIMIYLAQIMRSNQTTFPPKVNFTLYCIKSGV